MSDRAVPRITSVVPEAADKTPRRDASPFPAQDQIESLVRSRDSEYGKYDRMAQLTVALNDIFYAHMQKYNSNRKALLTDSQTVAIHMIFLKLSRIGNGNPDNIDSWKDIAGYAKLVADELQKDYDFRNAIPKATNSKPDLSRATGRAYDDSHQ